MSDPTHPVRLREKRPGEWAAKVFGFDVVALLLDGVWVCYVDGVEQFSAARLEVAEVKLERWLGLVGAVR